MSCQIVHISDPHFAAVTYNPMQFLSKRWLGNLNLMLFRNKSYQTDHLMHLPALFKALDVEAVCITGDMASTSRHEEFKLAKKFVDQFREKGMKTFVLPGNHDVYTKGAEREKRFYHYFPSEALSKIVLSAWISARAGIGWGSTARSRLISSFLMASFSKRWKKHLRKF